jgi:hypothetical protein
MTGGARRGSARARPPRGFRLAPLGAFLPTSVQISGAAALWRSPTLQRLLERASPLPGQPHPAAIYDMEQTGYHTYSHTREPMHGAPSHNHHLAVAARQPTSARP